MSEANKSIVNRLYAQVNAGELGVVDEVIADSFIEHEEMPGLAPGKEGVRQLFTTFRHAFEGASFEVDDLVAESDTVVAMLRMTGTQRGEFMGVSSTGRTINVGVADRFRVSDGRIVEHWGVMDTGAMMRQLTGS
jgi:predicted ester cyclase